MTQPPIDANALRELRLRLTRAEQTIAEQRQLLDEYANKLAESFEELTFFRRLARHVEYCDATRNLADVADGVLPMMRSLIRLEGLAIFLATQQEDGQRQVKEIAAVDGEMGASSQIWMAALGQLVLETPGVIVRNWHGLHAAQADTWDLPRVRSLAIVPIAKDGVVFGWLVGVNKEMSGLSNATAPGSDEIGATETSLLEAATVLLATHTANVRLVHEREQLVVDAIHTLVGVIEAKDVYTCGHSDRVALFGQQIAKQLNLPPQTCHEVYLTGLLHDIGKVAVADDVLLKPGALTDEEFERIKKHPECGWRLLQRLKPLQNMLPGVLHHHEAVDGSGYPHRLAGDDIPLAARILAVADAWDAMTSDRPYRNGMPWEKAEGIIRKGAGTQWDAAVVDAFFAARDEIANIMQGWRDDLHAILNVSGPDAKPTAATSNCVVGYLGYGSGVADAAPCIV